MVLARIVEPTSKADSLRVLAELGAPCPSLRTLFRAGARRQPDLPRWPPASWRQILTPSP
jgi:hypothetical protein